MFSLSYSVLLFPPVNSYRRFLIHKVCETITANQSRPLSTFSIGAGDQRRTVICHRYQLLVDQKSVSLKRFVDVFNCSAKYHSCDIILISSKYLCFELIRLHSVLIPFDSSQVWRRKVHLAIRETKLCTEAYESSNDHWHGSRECSK